MALTQWYLVYNVKQTFNNNYTINIYNYEIIPINKLPHNIKMLKTIK